jgi:hypothetical protein
MSNNDYEDDDFLEEETQPKENDLVKQLRKANKQKEKELAELKSQFENLSKSQRERAIKDVLEARGVNSKIAKFIPQDLDPTEESLSKWLSDNGDVFGVQQATTQSAVDPQQAAAYKKMNKAVDAGLTPDSNDDLLKKILNTQTKEELDEVLRNSGL